MGLFSLENVLVQRRQAHALEQIDRAFTEEIWRLEQLLEESKAREKRKDRDLQISEAYGEAMLAQVQALTAAAPNLPILAHTGRKLDNGKQERVIVRDVFIPTFDAALKRNGFKNPEKFRVQALPVPPQARSTK